MGGSLGERGLRRVGPFGVVGYTMSKIDRGLFRLQRTASRGLEVVRT